MSIKNRLKEILIYYKLNLKDFSEKVNIPYRTLQNYFLGLREPNIENLAKIATQFRINLNWLVTGEGEMFQTTMVSEEKAAYGEVDDITKKILILLQDMNEEQKREVLKHVEKEKLIEELLRQKTEKKEA